MSQSHSLLDTILDAFVPIHRDGHKFVGIAFVATVLMFILWAPLGWILAVVTAWVAYFFRDPDRVTPLREGLVVSAADGRISSIERVKPPAELGLGTEERVRVSTFLSVFDVHIQRAPVPGKIVRSIYVPGAFLNAALDKASEDNERRIAGCSEILGHAGNSPEEEAMAHAMRALAYSLKASKRQSGEARA